MAKQVITLHMYEHTEVWRTDNRRHVDQFDMRCSCDLMKDRVWIGQCEVEVDFPEIDTRQLQIDQLESQINRERADSEVRVNLLLDRISNLRAIGQEV